MTVADRQAVWDDEAGDFRALALAAEEAGEEVAARKLNARADYLEHMGGELPRMVEEQHLRAVADRRTWPLPSEEAVADARRELMGRGLR